jgi:hypothetical protein
MASKTMSRAGIENCITLALDATDSALPLTDLSGLDRTGQDALDRLRLRQQAFGQVLAAALDHDIIP